jgi:hypothetical protein
LIFNTATLDATGTASITATISTTSLAYYIGAWYSGDANNAASGPNPIHVFVNSAQTQTRIVSAPTTITLGDSYAATAQVTVLPPSTAAFPSPGTVFLHDNDNSSDGGVCMMTTSGGGIYACSFKPSTVGTHSLTASYFLSSGANIPAFAGSNSGDYPVIVNVNAPPSPTSVALTSTPNPSAEGTPVQFTATVRALQPASTGNSPAEAAAVPVATAAAITGTLTLREGDSTLASAAVGANGQAIATLSGLSVGNHVIVASYSGDGANTSSSTTLVQQVIGAGAGGNTSSAPALSPFALACIFLTLVVAGVVALWRRRQAF